MALSPVEQAFAEAALIEGLTTGPKLSLAIKVREASPQKKLLPQYCMDLKLIDGDNAKRLWKVADLGVKASPLASFSFSQGAMMGPYVLVEPRGPRALAGEHWRVKRPEGLGFLRLIPPGTGLDTERAQRLIDRANAGIDAPDSSILRVNDAGEEFNWLYVGSIGFDGESLGTRCSKGAIAEAEALVLLSTISQALRVAHGFGVVHAGLNPLAIVYAADGTPRVTDFGLGSTFFDGAAAGMRPGQRLGLLLYAAPELIAGSTQTGLDARADLYAAGALAYEAVSGVRAGDMRAPEGEPWVVKPPVSDGLATILRRLLAIDPEERYPSADALAQDVEKVQAGGFPGPLPPPGPPALVASRPSTASPQAVLTAELLHSAEASATTNLQPLAGGSLPASVGAPSTTDGEEAAIPGTTEESPESDGIELAPPTIDPDADMVPATGNDLDSEDDDGKVPDEPPPTDDPDRPRPAKPIKAAQKTLSRKIQAATKPPAESKGFAAMFVSLVVVAGAFGVAGAATAPDGAMLVRRELGSAALAMERTADREPDYRKAQDSIERARKAATTDAKLAQELASVESDLRRRRVGDYLAARKDPKKLDAAALFLEDSKSDQKPEDSKLECLHRIDILRRDSPGDAKLWKDAGQKLLEQGFPEDATYALEQATSRDALFAKDRERTSFALELGAFVPPGKYVGGKVTVAKALYVGRGAVTRGQYARWLDEAKKKNTLHASCSKKEPEGKSHDPQGWDPVAALAMNDPRPATGVDLWDALAYAKARGARLVTASERLALAEGTGTRPAPWGTGGFEPARANLGGVWGEVLPAGALAAGRSPLGGIDLAGNVEEWTAPESEEAAEAPVAGCDFATPADKAALEETRSTKGDERSPKRGFRCALDLAGGPGS